ncbi:hypothetical protein K2173_005454 [Erythroxylum novogranatense]|uniref:Uncharacterized protein n=1 Tax=Erythroxylum novogranatense TaxID=1862640 RepID=A0AAV8SKY5_9ROSI|nr:hypothetical protein K2173_005454 [Erythroxylum novogranatense]
MATFFSLTTPVGIGIGIGISSRYDENNPTALIIEGIFNSASAGILIYMALVDLLAADFMSPKVQSSGKLQLGVLEMGIVVHSVTIGISLGASESPNTIMPLVAALTFHQIFLGMGLGGCISQAKFKTRAITIMATFFSLTTPVGIGIGIGISSRYDENNPTALIVEGIFHSASVGILMYMAHVDLLAADLMSPKVQSSGKLQLGFNFFFLLGAGCMSLLAKWAKTLGNHVFPLRI